MAGRLSLVFFCCFVLGWVFLAGSSIAVTTEDRRVALVVGNGSYEDASTVLDNPANDAKAISAKFQALGIEVIEAIDLDYQGMRSALQKFDRALQGADAGIFYYAGHAMEYRGRNYLFPTDAVLETVGDVSLGLIDIDQILQVMETAVPTRLVFLDACRNNPLARSFRGTLSASRAAGIGSGLARIDTAVGTFIAYATAPGDIAADGKGQNSPFTTAVLTHLEAPGLDISQMMQRVRNSVVEATNQKQVPWDSSSLRGPFVLNLDITINPAPTASSTSTTRDESQRAETVFWESIKGSEQAADFDAYLERFGEKGVFAGLAANRLKTMQAEQARQREEALGFDRRKVQEALLDSGYDAGVADGLFGPKTRRAIKAWQSANDEKTTSYLSSDQVSAILARAVDQPKAAALANEGYSKAAKLYRKGCEDSDIDDCVDLAYLYDEGLGIKQDYTKSLELYTKGCDAGHARGCTNLGVQYEKGLGVKQDLAKGIELYKKGCDEGDAHGCKNFGWIYEIGRGVEQNHVKANELYEQACDSGSANGCTNLGYQYEKGYGTKQDYVKASEFYQEGCDGNYARGCSNLGYLFRKGLGVEKNETKAADLYKQSCDGGHAHGCKNLGYLYREGFGVEQDLAKAKELYQQACDDGNAEGCNALGKLLKN